MTRIVLRTDGGFLQGMGDVWAAIAIADALEATTDIAFVVSRDEEAAALIRERGHVVTVASTPRVERRVLKEMRPTVVVFSRMANPPEVLADLRSGGILLVTLDDIGPAAALADLRINPLYWTANADTDPRFAMLRDEFRAAWHEPLRVPTKVGALLVTQGGSDTHGFMKTILRSLAPLRGHLAVHLVIGPAFRDDEELEREIAGWGDALDVHRSVRAMAALMRAADLAITAAGLTLFECLCVGLPTIVVAAEPWEMETAQRLAALGATVDLGYGADLDPVTLLHTVDRLRSGHRQRSDLATRGRELVDGRGSHRIAEAIIELARRDRG